MDIARAEYKAHDIFFEGRDLDFLIDFSSFVTTRRFSEDNADIVRAVNAAYANEARWASAHPLEAETLAQKEAGYSDAVRDVQAKYQRRWEIHGVQDDAFLQKFQQAANWLSERKILPQKIDVKAQLARL